MLIYQRVYILDLLLHFGLIESSRSPVVIYVSPFLVIKSQFSPQFSDQIRVYRWCRNLLAPF